MYSYGPPHMAVQKQDDQHEHTFSSYVRIRDVVQKTCPRRWTIGKSGERGSGISVLPARHDDDDDNFPNGIRAKENLREWIGFELVYYDFAVQDVSHDVTGTHRPSFHFSSFIIFFMISSFFLLFCLSFFACNKICHLIFTRSFVPSYFYSFPILSSFILHLFLLLPSFLPSL